MAEPFSALRSVGECIEQACRRAARDPASVKLVAVSKTIPAERVRELLGHGQRRFGENRVQEALAKIPDVGAGAEWHLIGPLQRNKARHVVGAFELIHGVDNPKLAAELDRRSAAAGLRQAILVQLNLAGESSKSGIDAAGLPGLLEEILRMEHLELRGLMTIPPPAERPEEARRWFAQLRELRDRAADETGRPLPDLSMGMTDDFEIAVEEGATLVRVGRALFGERRQNPVE